VARLTLTTDDGEVLLVREDVTLQTVTNQLGLADLVHELRQELRRLEGLRPTQGNALRRPTAFAHGEGLKALRTARDLTQAALAELLGVAPNTVARWERDERRPSGAVRTRLFRWIEGKRELES